MSEQEVTTETPTTEAPLLNQPEARTTDGTIKDQAATQQTTKPEEKPEDKVEDKKPEDKPSAPEKYEAFTTPEGVKLSDEVIGKASELFKGSNLDQATAQKFVDFHTAEVQRIVGEAQKTYNDMRDSWRKEVLSDATLSHNNELRPEVKAAMSKAIDGLGPDLGPQFREALNLTGVGDNPAFVRGFMKFAEKFSEGTHVTGKSPAPTGQAKNGAAKPTTAQAMYPNLNSSNG